MTKTTFPDLNSLVAGLDNDINKDIVEKPETSESTEVLIDLTPKVDEQKSDQATLWSQFIEAVNDSKGERCKSSKAYKIDDEIAITLNQCNFNVSTTCIINCILKAFVVTNISKLSEFRKQQSKSYFDLL